MSVRSETKYIFTCNVCGDKEEHNDPIGTEGWHRIEFTINYSLGVKGNTKSFDVCKRCSEHYKIAERDGVIKSIINYIKGTK